MSRATNDQRAVEGVVVPGWERQLAVAHWLLSAARDQDVARREWLLQGAALLACGGIFAAVRLPGDLVRIAAQMSAEVEVNGFLRRALDGGPVIHGRYADHYYALVPGSTAWRRPPRAFPGLECLGRDCFLGVPAVDRTEPEGRAYWAVPMGSPGGLCDPRLVWVLVQLAQERHQAAEAAGLTVLEQTAGSSRAAR